jgi:hypothetical protein
MTGASEPKPATAPVASSSNVPSQPRKRRPVQTASVSAQPRAQADAMNKRRKISNDQASDMDTVIFQAGDKDQAGDEDSRDSLGRSQKKSKSKVSKYSLYQSTLY